MIKFNNNFLNARKQRKLANKISLDLQEQAMITSAMVTALR